MNIILYHAILTRFNLGLYRQARFHPAEWMNHRWALFKKFTAPSIAAQACRNFEWFVFFDNKTPDRAEIYKIGEELGFKPIFCEAPKEHSFDTAVKAFRGYLFNNRPPASALITTRLDNDDALHHLFIRDIQLRVATRPAVRPYALNFQHGFRLDLETGQAVIAVKRSNPFISLVEPFDNIADVRTVWARQHTHIKEIAPVLEIKGWHKWLQVAHGNNLLNKPLKGSHIQLSAIADDFGLEAA